MPALTIGADDFGVAGPVPAQAWFKLRRYRLDRSGPRLGSDRAWTVPLDAAGNATTALPPAMPGQALVITSNYPGFTQVTVAGYPDAAITLTELLAYEVDPTTLRPSASAAAAWDLVVGRVQAIVAAAASWAQDAAGSARAAAASALSSAAEAAASGTSAFNAGTSAATARGHANDAAASSAASSASAAEAVGVANTSVIDAFIRVVEEQARLIFRRKNNTEFDVGDIRGPQGLPGAGVPWGGTLAALDLNTVVTPGVYRQPNGASARLDRNYPYEGNSGVLEVFDVNSSAGPLFQRYSTVGGASGDVRGFYIRRRTNSTTWTAWQYVARQRVATDAGRAIYSWDDVNGRDQLIYGDTGFRNIAPSNNPVPYTSGFITIRRVGQLVQLSIVDLVLTQGLAGTLDLANLIPTGFRATVQAEAINTYPVPERRNRIIALAGQSTLRVPAVDSFTARICVTMQWFTNDTWPGSLPGVASGTIPNT